MAAKTTKATADQIAALLAQVKEPLTPQQIGMEPLALSVEAAAIIVSLSKCMIYDLIKAGELKPKKVGSRTLITVVELRRWLAAS
jgi:excisionase family DNA binding protein